MDGARDRGLIVNRTSEKVVRMLPPLNIEKADLDRAVEILDEVFAGGARGGAGVSTSVASHVFGDAPRPGGVTAPEGFTAAGLHCGIKAKPGALDLCVLAAQEPRCRRPASSPPTSPRPRR